MMPSARRAARAAGSRPRWAARARSVCSPRRGGGPAGPAGVRSRWSGLPTVRAGALPYGSSEALAEALLQALRHSPHLLGERFSAADVYIGSQIMFGLSIQGLPALPEFQAYVARLRERPASQRFERQAAEWAAQAQAKT